MNLTTKQTVTISNEDWLISIIVPSSSEYTQRGEFIVVAEDAYGHIDMSIATKEQIAETWSIDPRNLDDIL